MLARDASNARGVATIHIDVGRNQRPQHLFSDLPIRFDDVAASERVSLLDEDDKKRRRQPEWTSTAWGVAAIACTLLLLTILIVIAVVFHRVSGTFASIDSSVSLHATTANMLRSADRILNTSSEIAAVVHQLGLKGIDASLFSKPFLTHMLNTTDALLSDVHRVAEHPQIQIG